MTEEVKHPYEGKGLEQETRQRILTAAGQLMAQKGIKGATTRKIAELAGVNEVTLFRHFKNKEGILVALLNEMAAVRPMLEQVVRQANDDLEDLLLRYAEAYYHLLIERKDTFLICMIEAESERPDLAQLFIRLPETAVVVLMEALQRLSEQGKVKQQDFGTAAHMLLSTVLIEFFVRHRIGGETCPISEYEVFRNAVQVMLTGLRNP